MRFRTLCWARRGWEGLLRILKWQMQQIFLSPPQLEKYPGSWLLLSLEFGTLYGETGPSEACSNGPAPYIQKSGGAGRTGRTLRGIRSQTGLVACASVDDYVNNVIKKHENTREDKEIDRITHVDTCSAQTGPIFLAYRSEQVINEIVEKAKKKAPLYDFTAVDNYTAEKSTVK